MCVECPSKIDLCTPNIVNDAATHFNFFAETQKLTVDSRPLIGKLNVFTTLNFIKTYKILNLLSIFKKKFNVGVFSRVI